MSEQLAKAAEALADAGEIALACHMNPDPDALGSMLGLAAYLRSRGGKTICSFGNEPFVKPRWTESLEGADGLVPPSGFPKEPDLLVTLDAASLDRLGLLADRVSRAREVIWIDHHVSNPGLGTIPLIEPKASSTCEIVWHLIKAMGGEVPSGAAAALYAGMVTDTGRFQYESVDPGTLRVAAEIRAFPFDHTRLVQALYEDNSIAYLKLLGTALSRLTYVQEADLVWTYLTQADLAAAGIHPTETDDLIDVIRTARESDVAAVVKQQRDGWFKVSLRSRGRHDLATVSAEFGGGGHRLAAGYTSKAGLEDTVARLIGRLTR